MPTILEEIKVRLTEAQKQLTEATQALTAAQQKHQIAQHNFNIWNAAIQIETREEQARQTAAQENQEKLPLANNHPTPSATAQTSTAINNGHTVSTDTSDEQEGPNKTDIVRNLLRQHPTGMTAIDLWKSVSSEFKHRPYLYSVLKRLRDKNEISKRRNKYYLTAIVKTEEEKEHQVVH